MQYGFKSHAVKHEPIALQLLEQTLEFNQSINQSIRHLNWVYNFALRALEDANRLITDSKSRLPTIGCFQ